MFITLAVTDLDRLVHALLLAKGDYLGAAIDRANKGDDGSERWTESKRNIDALKELYDQLEQALIAETVEG